MSQRRAASRLVLFASVAALVASAIGTAATQAREGGRSDRTLRIEQDPGRASAGIRVSRDIDVAALPASTGKASPVDPSLGPPSDRFQPAAPSSVTVAPAPTFATNNGDPAIGQSTAFNGLAYEPASPTAGEPPDPWIAVGPEHVFQAVNRPSASAIDPEPTSPTVDMFDFFGLGEFYDPGEVAYFDPRVIYDSLHPAGSRSEASFDCFTRRIDVGRNRLHRLSRSRTGPDPTAGWQVHFACLHRRAARLPRAGHLDRQGRRQRERLRPGAERRPAGLRADVLPRHRDGRHGLVRADWQRQRSTSTRCSRRRVPNIFFAWRPAFQTPADLRDRLCGRRARRRGHRHMRGSPAAPPAAAVTVDRDLEPGGHRPAVCRATAAEATRVHHRRSRAPSTGARPTRSGRTTGSPFVSTYPCDPPGGAVENRDCVRVSELRTPRPRPRRRCPGLPHRPRMAPTSTWAASAMRSTTTFTSSGPARRCRRASTRSAYGAYQAAAAANNTISARALLSAGYRHVPRRPLGRLRRRRPGPAGPERRLAGQPVLRRRASSGRPRSPSSRPAAARSCRSRPSASSIRGRVRHRAVGRLRRERAAHASRWRERSASRPKLSR